MQILLQFQKDKTVIAEYVGAPAVPAVGEAVVVNAAPLFVKRRDWFLTETVVVVRILVVDSLCL